MKENIEEDIEILEHIKMGIKADTQAPNVSIRNVAIRKFEAIEHILSDYQRLQEEFKQVDHECERLEQKELKLEKENEELKLKLERQKEINTIISQKNIDKNYEKALEKTMTKFLNDNIDRDFIPKQKVKDILNEINKEYIKQEEIFNKHFEKEERDMQDYYIQKEATNTMQELSWVEGKLQDLLESERK